MKIAEKRELKEQIRKKFQKEAYWEAISDSSKDHLLEDTANIFAEETDEINKLLKKRKEWIDIGIILIIGIFIGIAGGLIANIVHVLLMPFGIYYYIIAFIIFVIIFYILFDFIKNTNKSEDVSEIWKKFLEHIHKKYEKEKEK